MLTAAYIGPKTWRVVRSLTVRPSEEDGEEGVESVLRLHLFTRNCVHDHSNFSACFHLFVPRTPLPKQGADQGLKNNFLILRVIKGRMNCTCG